MSGSPNGALLLALMIKWANHSEHLINVWGNILTSFLECGFLKLPIDVSWNLMTPESRELSSINGCKEIWLWHFNIYRRTFCGHHHEAEVVEQTMCEEFNIILFGTDKPRSWTLTMADRPQHWRIRDPNVIMFFPHFPFALIIPRVSCIGEGHKSRILGGNLLQFK